jgi:hypothetical protein
MSYERRLFTAMLQPWAHGFEVYVHEVHLTDPKATATFVGVTSVIANDDREVENMTRDYLSLFLELPRRAFDVVPITVPPGYENAGI